MADRPVSPETHTGPADHRLLTPGWAGVLGDDELPYLVDQLHRDPKLAYLWGFKRRQRRYGEGPVRRVAMAGNPDLRRENPGAGPGQKRQCWGQRGLVLRAGEVSLTPKLR